MQSIEIIEMNTRFEKYLLSLFDLMNLKLNIVCNSKFDKKADYLVVNSISKKNKILSGKYCFVNMDLIDEKRNKVDISGCILTYGLGNKNTVTISSLDYNNGFVYCLQRDIMHQGKKIIEAQEIPVSMALQNIEKLYAAVVAITIGLMEERCIDSLIKNKTFITLN